MVSIPVRLFKAARRERIRFHHVYRPGPDPDSEPEEDTAPDPLPKGVREFPRRTPETPPPSPEPAPEPEPVARVRYVPTGDVEDAPVERSQLLKGFEIEKDRYVTFEPQEVAALRPRTSTELSIAEFVRLEEIDPVFFETSYYAVPDPGGEKPYALLFRALSETRYAAVGSLAMHGREHATVIRPGTRGLILHTLFYQAEVRADQEYQIDPALVTAKELDLAKMLIGALAAPFDPGKLKDTFEERLRSLIEARAQTAVSAYQHAESPNRAPVVDIMEALRKSLEMAKKPPQSERSKGPAREKAPRARARRSRP